MKKMNKYILWLLPVFGLFACEDEMEVYNSPENRLNFIYEPYTMADTVILRTFVYDVETRVFDTVCVGTSEERRGRTSRGRKALYSF